MPLPPLPGLRGGRPEPYRDRHLDTTTPREDARDIAAWLQCLTDVLEGRQRPGSAPQPQVTEKLRFYAAHYRSTVAELDQARAAAERRAAAMAAPAPPVGGAAHLVSVSPGDEITTTQAARRYGKGAEFWRRKAVAGQIRARKVARNSWALRLEDVIAETRRRSGHGTGSGAGPAGAPGDPGGAPGGGGARGGRAP